MSRLTLTAETPEQLVTATAQAVGAAGGTEFEVGYTAADRVLADGEEPTDDERIEWYVRAVIRRRIPGRRPLVTEYRAARTTENVNAGHVRALADSCVELLETLGINVVVLDDTAPDLPPAHPSA